MGHWRSVAVVGVIVAGWWGWMQEPAPPPPVPAVMPAPAHARVPLPSTQVPDAVTLSSRSVTTPGDADGMRSCLAISVRGSHTALSQLEAQEGAIEDMTDICPSHLVTKVQQRCEPDRAASDVLLQRCSAEGQCQLCGEHRARYRALHKE